VSRAAAAGPPASPHSPSSAPRRHGRASRSAPAHPRTAEAPSPGSLHELFAEAYRLRLLRALEVQLAHCGFARIAGTDETGRGALAGPVVAAAVVLDGSFLFPGVDAIRRRCLCLAVASVSAQVIDRINILEASREAMQRALAALAPPPDCAVVDAVALRGLGFPCLPVVRGDAISYAVACASIIAKVERDRLMVELDRRYPQYGFAAHKGYCVPEHVHALAVYGPCPEHRLTFEPVVPRLARRGPERMERGD
jgi:ribonuclease HII